MRERPILFSAPMVRALLAGTKTQTRREVKPQTAILTDEMARAFGVQPPLVENSAVVRCPYGAVGDRLWVKETWKADQVWDDFRPTDIPTGEPILYTADDHATRIVPFGWGRGRPSIFMRRWMSRIILEIVSVRVERLNDISESDAHGEGIFRKDYGRVCGHFGKWQDVGECSAPEHTHPQLPGWQWRETSSHTECLDTARGAFANLWNHVNGPSAWCANPWVWVLEFKRVEARS